MMSFLKFIMRKHPFLAGIFGLALLATAFFAIDLGRDWLYFKNPDHREQTLKPWMTPRYVGMSWGLPRELMEDVMELPKNHEGRPPKVKDIAERLGLTLPELQARVASAKAEFEAARQRKKQDKKPQAPKGKAE